MYTYPPEEIKRLKETLQERAFANSTPKKYSVPMFEAYEVITQLQKELKGKEAAADA